MEFILIPVFILACLLLILMIFTVPLYILPVRFAISVLRHDGSQENSLSVSWGTFCVRILDRGDERKMLFYIGGYVLHSRVGREVHRKHDDAKSPVPADLHSVAGYVTLIPQLIEPVGKFGAVLFDQTTFDGIRGWIRIGAGDAAATGMLYGGYWATRSVLRASKIYVEMIPEFNRKILELDLVIRLRINHPLRVGIAGIRLFKNPAIRNGIVLSKPQLKGVTQV